MEKREQRSVADIIEEYMEENPILCYYLNENLINISSLARKIKKELNLNKSFEAIMISIYRFAQKKQAVYKIDEAKSILSKTTLNIYSDYVVLVADLKQKIKAKNLIAFSNTQVAIGEKSELVGYKNNALYYQDGLSLIELKHNKNIEKIPGVLFYILAMFYQQGINIIEVFSAWDSTYLLIEKKHIEKVIKMKIFK